MKYISIAAILALITGCGGGGGGVPAGNPGPGGQGNAQLTQQIIEACASGNVDFLLEILGIVQGVADPATPVPTLTINGVDIVNLVFNWEFDRDLDMIPDIAGTIGFDDGAGGLPTIDLTPVANQGIAGLPQVLASLADGDRLLISFNLIDPMTTTSGIVLITFLSGLPSTADGMIDSQDANCSATITFTSTDVATLFTGGTPTATFDIAMTGADGTITGTMSFNGTNTVQFDVMFGADNFTFTYDIVTGQVTQVP